MQTAGRRIRISIILSLVALLALALGAFPPAASGSPPASQSLPPNIVNVTPSSATVGEVVTLTSFGGGYGFGDQQGTVTFCNDAVGQVTSWTDDEVKVRVPQDAYGGTITLNMPDGYSDTYAYFYVEPSIDSAFPSNYAIPGQRVALKGGGFSDGGPEDQVHFYDVSRGDTVIAGTDISLFSNNKIQFAANGIAPGVYEVFVSTYVGTTSIDYVESNRILFSIEGDPVITSVSPNPCPRGGILTITGSGFGDVRTIDEGLWFQDVSTGDRINSTSFPTWLNGTIKTNHLPNYDGTFKILVSRAVIAPTPSLQITQTSNEMEVTITSDPVPPEDQVVETSRTWAHDSIGTPSPSKNWYLAEGSTAGGDETWVLVQNPNDESAHVTLTYVTSSDTEEMPTDTIPANSRKTYNAATAFPDTAGVSVKVESDVEVIAEKAMYGNSRTWALDSIGISQPANEWYLAEGCTAPGFDTRVSVMNPNDSAANVTLTYMTPSGPVDGPLRESTR